MTTATATAQWPSMLPAAPVYHPNRRPRMVAAPGNRFFRVLRDIFGSPHATSPTYIPSVLRKRPYDEDSLINLIGRTYVELGKLRYFDLDDKEALRAMYQTAKDPETGEYGTLTKAIFELKRQLGKWWVPYSKKMNPWRQLVGHDMQVPDKDGGRKLIKGPFGLPARTGAIYEEHRSTIRAIAAQAATERLMAYHYGVTQNELALLRENLNRTLYLMGVRDPATQELPTGALVGDRYHTFSEMQKLLELIDDIEGKDKDLFWIEEQEYEKEIETDAAGDPVFDGAGEDKKPKLKLDADGNPIDKIFADGKKRVLLNEKGEPVTRRIYINSYEEAGELDGGSLDTREKRDRAYEWLIRNRAATQADIPALDKNTTERREELFEAIDPRPSFMQKKWWKRKFKTLLLATGIPSVVAAMFAGGAVHQAGFSAVLTGALEAAGTGGGLLTYLGNTAVVALATNPLIGVAIGFGAWALWKKYRKEKKEDRVAIPAGM